MPVLISLDRSLLQGRQTSNWPNCGLGTTLLRLSVAPKAPYISLAVLLSISYKDIQVSKICLL